MNYRYTPKEIGMLNDEIDRLREERDDERAKRYVLEKSNAWFLVAEQQKQEIERLRAALIQIREVCDDNAPASCNQAMALAFVRSVVVHTLNEQKQDT